MSEQKLNINEELKQLDEIVSELQSKSLPLEESTKLYEKGIEIVKRLESELKDIEKKIGELETVIFIEDK